MATNRLVLLTGATRHIGGRLLKAQGTRVRCMARQPEFKRARVAGDTEIVAGDVLDYVSLDQAMSGVANRLRRPGDDRQELSAHLRSRYPVSRTNQVQQAL